VEELAMAHVEKSCGHELAQGAEVPEKLAELFAHVAKNMDVHAAWAGKESPDAAREHDAMRSVAEAYRKIATAAGDAAALMRGWQDLPSVPHDPARLDRRGLAEWMRAKVEMQRAFARMLLEHAALSERVLEEMTHD
jgi:hypothetical protein